MLASASPRRRQLLLDAGISHIVRPANVPEERLRGESPETFARRLAQEKAAAVCRARNEIVLGADTIVVLGDEVFGKPRGENDARRMLGSLSGRDHWVYTGICMTSDAGNYVDLAPTKVSFLRLSDAEIDGYVESGEPMDKAGAYAIQGLASKFISGIEGSYSNVVGLPVSLVYRYLQAL